MLIMQRGSKATILTLAAFFASGCAKSDYSVSQRERRSWKPVDDAAIASAPEAAPPKILPETFFAAGLLFEHQGHIASALHQYRKATAVNHTYAAAYHRLGLMLSLSGKQDQAIEAISRAVALKPDDPIFRNNLGFTLMLQERWSDAEIELRRAIELLPDFARAHINLGISLSRMGRFDESLSSFLTVLPETDAHYNLGLMLRGQQRYQEAANRFGHVLSLNPSFTAAAAQLEELAAYIPPEDSSNPRVDVPSWHTMAEAEDRSPIGDSSHIDVVVADDDEEWTRRWAEARREAFERDESSISSTNDGASGDTIGDDEGARRFDEFSRPASPWLTGGSDVPRFSMPRTSFERALEEILTVRRMEDDLAILRNEIACLQSQGITNARSLVVGDPSDVIWGPPYPPFEVISQGLTPVATGEPGSYSGSGQYAWNVEQEPIESFNPMYSDADWIGTSGHPTGPSTMSMTVVEEEEEESDRDPESPRRDKRNPSNQPPCDEPNPDTENRPRAGRDSTEPPIGERMMNELRSLHAIPAEVIEATRPISVESTWNSEFGHLESILSQVANETTCNGAASVFDDGVDAAEHPFLASAADWGYSSDGDCSASSAEIAVQLFGLPIEILDVASDTEASDGGDDAWELALGDPESTDVAPFIEDTSDGFSPIIGLMLSTRGLAPIPD